MCVEELHRIRWRPLACLLACAAASVGHAAPSTPKTTQVIAALDTQAGIQLKRWSLVASARLEFVTDPALVTQGKAAMRMAAKTGDKEEGSKYVSAVVTVKPFVMKDSMLLMDVGSNTPQNTRGLYVRLRDAKGRVVASWATWSFRANAGRLRRTRLQQGFSLDGLGYEKKLAEAADAPVTTIEIIMGAKAPNVEYDLVVDNVRLWNHTVQSLKTLETPKKLVLQTTFDSALVAAAAETPRPALAKLLAQLRRLAGQESRVTIGDAARVPDWAQTTVLVGNVTNNAAILPLYAHGYCSVDRGFPGAGGYVVRVIHDPFGTGKNVVLVGASDAKGLGLGIEALILKLKRTPSLGPLVDVALGDDAAKAWRSYSRPPSKKQIARRLAGVGKALAGGGARGVCSEMARCGLAYRMSGRPEWAEQFKGLAYEYEKWVHDPNRKYGAHEGQWGMDVDFTTYRVIPAWDVLEECPVFSSEDRLRISRLLAAFVAEDTYPCGRSVLRGPGPRHNHQTFPCLGMYFAGRYFGQIVDSFEAEHWLETAAACFGCQATYLKAREDAAGYQWLVPVHTMQYGLAVGDMAAFLNGNARRLSDLAIALTDNLGHHPAFGDHSGYGGWGVEMNLLHYAAFVHGDGRYQWTIDKKMSVSRRAMLDLYACALPAAEPVDLAGVRSFPLPRIMFEHCRQTGKIEYSEGFDKISFREDFDEGTEYFLLDGINGTSHGHYDGNAVLRLLARRRLWLEDGDYIKSLPKFHNTLLIFRDGQSEKPSTFVKLEELAGFPRAGFSQTLLRDYAGADWRRSVLWVKARGYVVVDTVTANTPGDYRARCVWRGMGHIQHDARSVMLEQQGEALRILSAVDADMALEDDEVRGHNWRGYKLAPPVVRVLGIHAGGQLAQGESTAVYSVLRPSAAQDAGDLEARVLAPGIVRVECDGKPFVFGTRPARTTRPTTVCDGVATDAVMFRFEADGFEVVNATRVSVLGWQLQASAPICLSLDSRTGRALLVAGQAGHLIVDQGPRTEFAAGRWELALTGPQQVPALQPSSDKVVAFAPGPWRASEAKADRGFEVDWRFEARPTRLLVTNNTGRFGAVDLGATCGAEPSPRKKNCFNFASPNHVAALSDGGLRTTEGSVMWPIDAKVSLAYDLRQAVKVSEVALKVWFGSMSSKGESFMTERIRVRLSNDNFERDDRLVLDHVDDAKHEDWGQPLTVSCRGDGKPCRWVRIELSPREGSSVYLSEIEIWGDGDTIVWKPTDEQPAIDFLSVAHGPRGVVALGGSEGGVYLIDSKGKLIWRKETKGAVPSVWCGDIDRDGEAEVVAGSRDGTIYCFARDGSLRWTHTCERYHGRTGALVVVFAADLDGDGKLEVVAGSDNWHFHTLGHDGSFLWKFETVHRSTCGAAADLDADGKQEVIAGTEYYSWTVIRHDGKRYWRRGGGPCANSVAAGDLDGDGKLEVAFGSANGMVYVNAYNGKALWQFDAGDEITAVKVVDLDNDGKAEVVAASLNCNVYVLGADGKVRWRRDLGAAVSHLTVLAGPDPLLVVGCGNGLVVSFSADGKQVGSRQLGGAVRALVEAGPRSVLGAAASKGLARLRVVE